MLKLCLAHSKAVIGGVHGAVSASCLAAVWLSLPTAIAAAPEVDYLAPAGGQVGTSFSVTSGGRLDGWPLRVWADDPGLVFKAGSSRGQFQVAIGPSAKPGPHLIRVFDAQGASAPRLFLVGPAPEQPQTEAATRGHDGQSIESLPVTINGVLAKPGEKHTFLLKLETADVLLAIVDSYRLDAPLVSSLVLTGIDSTARVADENKQGRDPKLSFTCPQSGVYRLELAAAAAAGPAWAGGPDAVYRLTLSREKLVVPDLPKPSNNQAEGLIVWPYRVGQQVQLPSTIHGFINPAGIEDHYLLEAKQGQQCFFQVRPNSPGSAPNAVLKVVDEAGNAIAQAEPGPDPRLTWVVPADGTYTLVVKDAKGQGGSVFPYELELGTAVPHLAGTLGTHTFSIAPGRTLELTANVTRPRYFKGVVVLVVTGLPSGVIANGPVVPPEGGDVSITLTAAADAPAANQPFQVLIMAPNEVPPQVSPLRAAVNGRHAAAGELLVNETDKFWLTVLPGRNDAGAAK